MEIGVAPFTRAGDLSPLTPLIPQLQAIEAHLKDPNLSNAVREMILRFGPSLFTKREEGADARSRQTLEKVKGKQRKGVAKPIAPVSPPRAKEKKRPEFTYCLSRGVRHSYKPYIRDISTPDWAESRCGKVASISCDGAFDRATVHGLLETYESRIQNGRDKDRLHPALSISAYTEGLELVRSAFETEKADKYEEVRVRTRVPQFWPKRVWDTPEDLMSAEQSQHLSAELAGLQLTGMTAKAPSVKAPSGSRPKRSMKKVVRTNALVLHRISYVTDEEDDTDWEDF
jgi:hypothetical protein